MNGNVSITGTTMILAKLGFKQKLLINELTKFKLDQRQISIAKGIEKHPNEGNEPIFLAELSILGFLAYNVKKVNFRNSFIF